MKPYSEKITFASSAGDLLAASLELPVAPPRAYALFAHCFTCSKDYVAASWITRSLAAEEIAVLRFDFTGLGNSQGDFANTNFSSNVEDLLAAATFLRENYSAPEILVGHSLGGTASIVAASKLPDVKAVAPINAPHSPAHLKRHLQAAESEITARGEAIVNLAGRPFKIKKQFLDDLRDLVGQIVRVGTGPDGDHGHLRRRAVGAPGRGDAGEAYRGGSRRCPRQGCGRGSRRRGCPA